MSNAQTPTLEDLRKSSEPSWLWDWQAGRVVWANDAGLAYFGCETLFDLIDRPFDISEPGVERIVEVGRTLRRGQRQTALLFFPSTGRPSPADVTCYVHALSDGRPGVLAVSQRRDDRQDSLNRDALAQAFDALPGAAMVLTKDGTISYANAAATRMLGAHAQDIVADLLERAEMAGTVSAIKAVETALGTRDMRVTVRILPVGSEAYAVGVADDVTERRALEKRMSGPATSSAFSGVDAGLSPTEAEAFESLGLVLRGEASMQPRPRRVPQFPAFIRKSLDAMAGANLFIQKGQLEYVSPQAAKLLGFADPEEAMASESLLSAIGGLSESARELDLPCADGSMIVVSIKSDRIAWRSGPALRVGIEPLSPSEHVAPALAQQTPDHATAVTLESPETVAMTAPETASSSSAPLPAQSNVVPLHIEASPIPVQEYAASISEVEPLVADAELRAILDTASDGIVMLDADGRIMSCSAGAEAIFGYRSAEVKQRPFAELMTAESRKTVRDYLAALQGPGLASVFNDGREVSAVVKQGGEVPLFLTIAKLQQQAKGKAALCAVVRDITQWKKTEAELRRARDEAEQASRLKSEFLANVSHELRTPLNAIIGFSEMMRMESFGEIENEKYRSYVNDIHSSGAHLLSLINDLLDLSKVEAGKLELNFTSVNLGEVTDHAFKLVQEAATQARVILRKNIPEELPNVVADLRSMRQIMLNILSNAVKFTDPGGQVIVSAQMTPEGELKLRVKDTGVGMSSEALSTALEPFRRVATEGREAQGTGLGLPLTKALAEANRTRFDISSEPGKGTVVEITFPTTRVLAA